MIMSHSSCSNIIIIMDNHYCTNASLHIQESNPHLTLPVVQAIYCIDIWCNRLLFFLNLLSGLLAGAFIAIFLLKLLSTVPTKEILPAILLTPIFASAVELILELRQ